MAMRPTMIPFAPWIPDDPAYGGEQAVRALGVIPAAKGYRPFPSPVMDGPALPSRVTGAFNFFGPGKAVMTLAGTTDSLYLRQQRAWTKLAGAWDGANGWAFAAYGDMMVATNGIDAPMYATKGADMTFNPLAGAPKASAVNVVGNFVMLGGLTGNPAAVQWSAIDNPLSWPEPGSSAAQYAQSDIQVFPDVGRVMAIATGMSGYDGLVFCETGISRLQYVGPPYVFQISPVDKTRGTIAPRSVVAAENLVYFLAEDGFFATDGGTVQNIGAEKINEWWRENADNVRRSETQGVYDPVTGVVAWAFASTSCAPGVFDRILILQPILGRFALAETETELIYLDAARGATLEDLDAYGPLDSLPFSLDSKAFMGGVRVLAGFDPSHRTIVFSGLPVAAHMETAETGGARMMIHAARPLIDGADGAVKIRYRDFQAGVLAEKVCGPPSRLDGLCHARISTRYARVGVDIPASTDWKNAIGVELYLEEEGGL